MKCLNISGEKALFLVSVETQVLRKKEETKKINGNTYKQNSLCWILDEQQDPVFIAAGNL